MLSRFPTAGSARETKTQAKGRAHPWLVPPCPRALSSETDKVFIPTGCGEITAFSKDNQNVIPIYPLLA